MYYIKLAMRLIFDDVNIYLFIYGNRRIEKYLKKGVIKVTRDIIV